MRPSLLLLVAWSLLSPTSAGSQEPPPMDRAWAVDEGDDADGDGFSVDDEPPDCDDTNPDVYPGAPERSADGVDQDCDGTEYCYADEDGDGYGTDVTALADLACTEPGAASRRGDCNDRDPEINPDGREFTADGVDSDCNGGELCYWDEDLDGYGAQSFQGSQDMLCDDARESPVNTDCDDADPTAYPEAAEACDGRDNDCDDLVDEDIDCDLVDDKGDEDCSCGRARVGGGLLLALAALLAIRRRAGPGPG